MVAGERRGTGAAIARGTENATDRLRSAHSQHRIQEARRDRQHGVDGLDDRGAHQLTATAQPNRQRRQQRGYMQDLVNHAPVFRCRTRRRDVSRDGRDAHHQSHDEDGGAQPSHAVLKVASSLSRIGRYVRVGAHLGQPLTWNSGDSVVGIGLLHP